MSPEAIERQAAEAGLTLKELCARARIAQSTFYRWRSGDTEPQVRIYRRIKEVLREARAVQ